MKIRRYLLGGLLLGGIAAVRMMRRQARTIEAKDRVALITGGSRGLGLVMARQLAREGAKVVICARNEKELQEAADDLSAYTDDFLSITCDISDKNSVKSMVDEIKEKMGEVEILINNAGIIQVGPMETMTEEDYEYAMKVHFWGPFNTINAVLPGMRRRQAGRIVNIVSINGKVTFPHLLPYTVSKYALAGYSEGSSAELAKDGIRVTSVYPTLMRTGSPRNIDVKSKAEQEYGWFKVSDSIPGIAMNAETAARKIINCMKAGDKILTLGIPSKLAVAMEGLAPSLNLSLFDLANRVLPEKGGIGTDAQKGYESESKITQSKVTQKTQEAAERNNEK